MPIRARVTWFTLLVVAIANGWFREALLVPRFGLQISHIVSTILLAGGISVVTFLAVRWIRPADDRSAIAIGLAWLVLTLLFEFGFGRFRGKPPQLKRDPLGGAFDPLRRPRTIPRSDPNPIPTGP